MPVKFVTAVPEEAVTVHCEVDDEGTAWLLIDDYYAVGVNKDGQVERAQLIDVPGIKTDRDGRLFLAEDE